MAVAQGPVVSGDAETILRMLAARMDCAIEITAQRVSFHPFSVTEEALIAARNADGRHPIG